MQTTFTAVFQKVPDGYLAFVEELPRTNAHGVTLDEARGNLRAAVERVVEANRALIREELGESEVIRESLTIAAG